MRAEAKNKVSSLLSRVFLPLDFPFLSLGILGATLFFVLDLSCQQKRKRLAIRVRQPWA